MKIKKVIDRTQSLCPVCLIKTDAVILFDGKCYTMKKSCPEHGSFEAVVWRGSSPMENWKIEKEWAHIKKPATETRNGCPYDCGLCPAHRQHTCTALIEVTDRCNLSCRFCFADAGSSCEADPSLGQISKMYQSVINSSGKCNIQLSGGEPTLRDDLPEIIRLGKQIGFEFIQLNTNGIRLAEDERFVAELKTAGLDSLFLQFDGTNDEIYRQLRGRDLLSVKIKAIENCSRLGIGVVVVPALVPGINTDNIGEIVRFALNHISAVRGVHFQPVSYFGRMPQIPKDDDRITLPEIMDELEKQTCGLVKIDSLKPPGCENSLCSFHGRYLYQADGSLVSVGKASGCCEKKAEEGARKAKVYVSSNWTSRAEKAVGSSMDCWDEIMNSIKMSSFSISAMAFQDVWNIDLNRVMDCCIHVVSPDGRLIPFCAYNLTDAEGRPLYRKHNGGNL